MNSSCPSILFPSVWHGAGSPRAKGGPLEPEQERQAKGKVRSARTSNCALTRCADSSIEHSRPGTSKRKRATRSLVSDNASSAAVRGAQNPYAARRGVPRPTRSVAQSHDCHNCLPRSPASASVAYRAQPGARRLGWRHGEGRPAHAPTRPAAAGRCEGAPGRVSRSQSGASGSVVTPGSHRGAAVPAEQPQPPRPAPTVACPDGVPLATAAIHGEPAGPGYRLLPKLKSLRELFKRLCTSNCKPDAFGPVGLDQEDRPRSTKREEGRRAQANTSPDTPHI